VHCTHCGNALGPGVRFCGACGRPVAGAAATAAAAGFFQDVVAVSLREVVLADRRQALEILKSPVFLFLCLVAVVPLAIQVLDGVKPILNGLAIWSGVLWALLLFRLFGDRDLPVTLAIGTVFFTAFVGLPLLEVYLALPPHLTETAVRSRWLPVRLVGYVLGVGVREEVCKAIPLFLLAWLTTRMRNPLSGVVLGMMSGVGFAIAENVYYVFKTLESALGAASQTGRLGYLAIPIYNNVVRMAMTPFLHGCLSGVFGYFIALAAADRARRWPLLVTGLALSALLHGLFDTFVGMSPLYGVVIEAGTFFLVLTFVLKARGLSAARELAGGVFDRTVLRQRIPGPAGPATAAPMAVPAVVPPAVRQAEAATEVIPRPPGAAARARTWQLRGLAGPASGRVFPLDGEVRIGRDASRSAIHLEDDAVSRQHALLVTAPDGGGWRVRRLSTTNPLMVNGLPIEDTLLAAGDRLTVGASTLVIEQV
jgi:RsiW-degrading membrane proteinase PrsW (M82 family)